MTDIFLNQLKSKSFHGEVMKFKKIALVTLLSLGVSATSSAGEWGVGAFIGQASIDDAKDVCPGVCTFDDSDTSMGLNLTYGFNDNWGVEAGYMDLGTYSLKFTKFSNLKLQKLSGDIDASALYLAGTGRFYFSDTISVAGRLGMASAKAEANVLQFSESKTSSEVYVGFSVDYDIQEKFKVGLRADSISDVTSIGLAAHFTF